jgi:hypothetical protein
VGLGVVQDDLGMAGVALVKVRRPIEALAVGMVIEAATAIAVATMVDVQVVGMVIGADPAVVISVGSVGQWALDVAPVVAITLVDSVEIVDTVSDLQIAAGKPKVFMPFSIGK